MKLSVSSSYEFMWHLLKVPMNFFSQRSVGDVISRLGAVNSITKVISSGISVFFIQNATFLSSEYANHIPSLLDNNSTNISQNFEQSIDEKIDKFFLIFKEKDKMLEEKNKVIFMLQQRVAELETKLQHMIALPDYNKEKQEMLLEKEKLENKIGSLQGIVKTEKNKNMVFIGLALIFVAIAGFLFLKG